MGNTVRGTGGEMQQLTQLMGLEAELGAIGRDEVLEGALHDTQREGKGRLNVFSKPLKSGFEVNTGSPYQSFGTSSATSTGALGSAFSGAAAKDLDGVASAQQEQKAISPDELVVAAQDYLAEPLVSPREVTGADGTDALIFASMFLFIDIQRLEVAKMMDTVKYNNDMARELEQLKARVQAAVDRMRGSDAKNPTEKLDPQVADYIWANNVAIGGVPVREKYGNVADLRSVQWTATDMTQIGTALEIKRTEYTDMNSQNMQKLQMGLGLLQVFQQMLTGLIDSWKRIKESIASKL